MAPADSRPPRPPGAKARDQQRPLRPAAARRLRHVLAAASLLALAALAAPLLHLGGVGHRTLPATAAAAAAARAEGEQGGAQGAEAVAAPRELLASSSAKPCPWAKGGQCPEVVPEADYLSTFGDKDGSHASIASLGIDAFGPGVPPVRVYVYDPAHIPPLKGLVEGDRFTLASCSKGMWGTQTLLHMFLKHTPSVRAARPEEADYFFVPAYPKCVLDQQKLSEDRVNEMYIAAIQQMPYFRRSGGRDHIFVFPSGRGATTFPAWKEHIAQSIFLGPEGHFTDNYASVGTPYFSTWKDIVIPGRLDTRKDGLASAAKLQRDRRNLAIFYGTAQRKKPRKDIMKLAKRHQDVLADESRTPRYFELMGDSQFCFAPRGQSSWTLRFYESFFAGCIPVILADSIELPYADVLDYSQFTIKWPMTSIDDSLVDYLRSVPLETRERMAAAGRRIRCLFVYHPDPTKCNAFSALLWQLARRKRVLQQNRETFWVPDAGVVDRKMVPFSQWQGPFPTAGLYNQEPTERCTSCKWGGPNNCVTTDTGITCKLDSDRGRKLG